jgi:hypothetical protein
LRAQALHDSTFVWADAPGIGFFPSPLFSSTSSNQFLIRASGGVGIGTAASAAALHVAGGTDVTPGGGGFIVTGATNGFNAALDENEIMARNNGAVSALFLNVNGGRH